MQFSLSEARRYRGMTQKSVATALGISRTAYISLEKMPENMTIEKAKKFSLIVDLSLEEIVFLPQSSTIVYLKQISALNRK